MSVLVSMFILFERVLLEVFKLLMFLGINKMSLGKK
jgi:hypothetical protein